LIYRSFSSGKFKCTDHHNYSYTDIELVTDLSLNPPSP
jgi:hypothetical protein